MALHSRSLPFYTMAHPTVTVGDILLFYNIDRAVYDKFVNGGMEPGIARNAVAIFMCLDQFDMDLVAQIARITDPIKISQLIAEANTVLHHLRPNNYPRNCNEIIPLITSLAKNYLDICLNSDKDLIVKGAAYILDGVGRIVFDDHMYELLRTYETKKAVARAILRVAMPVVSPELAMLWAMMPVVPPELATLYDFAATAPLIEDARSTFLTFRRDSPIREGDILEYFKSVENLSKFYLFSFLFLPQSFS